MEPTEPLPAQYVAALKLIDEAHAQDPRTVAGEDGPVPYELHYARKMTRWLAARKPDASPALQLACRAQHFRRWELPRSSYPMTRAGYLTWRAKQKAQAAAQVAELLSSAEGVRPGLGPDEIERVAALVRKENLHKGGDEETQALEDVACLVFLDDKFDDFDRESDLDEDKMVDILRKTWAKMSDDGRRLALGMQLSERATRLLRKALDGGS